VPSAIFNRIGAIGAAVALAFSVPAAAQGYSEGYKFLQKVEKRERNEAIDMATKPGSTVVNARDVTNGRTGLHIAVARRDQAWVDLLLQLKANPNLADNAGVTPLMLAVQLGWAEGMASLVAAKARVDEPNGEGETPLIYAVHARNIGMMRILLAAGAKPDRADNSGRSARDYAALAGGSVQAELARVQPVAAKPAAKVYGPN
jgi:ankyrin repeat protein